MKNKYFKITLSIILLIGLLYLFNRLICKSDGRTDALFVGYVTDYNNTPVNGNISFDIIAPYGPQERPIKVDNVNNEPIKNGIFAAYTKIEHVHQLLQAEDISIINNNCPGKPFKIKQIEYDTVDIITVRMTVQKFKDRYFPQAIKVPVPVPDSLLSVDNVAHFVWRRFYLDCTNHQMDCIKPEEEETEKRSEMK